MSHKAPYSGMNLLIVDDDATIRALVSRIAGSWSYETAESASAEDALQLLSKRKYNIVLTDIKMGKMDGIAFAEQVRQKMPSIAVVIMTGNPSPKTAKQSHELGAIYYMQKPIAMEELGDTLRIAASWNIGMLIDRAAKRFLALRKGHERDHENRLKAVKDSIRWLLATSGWCEHLRDFVYITQSENSPLFQELNKKFSADSVKPF